MVHSCRFGFILGKVVRHGMTDQLAEYLRTIYQQSPADDGGVIEPDVIDLVRKRHYGDIASHIPSSSANYVGESEGPEGSRIGTR